MLCCDTFCARFEMKRLSRRWNQSVLKWGLGITWLSPESSGARSPPARLAAVFRSPIRRAFVAGCLASGRIDAASFSSEVGFVEFERPLMKRWWSPYRQYDGRIWKKETKNLQYPKFLLSKIAHENFIFAHHQSSSTYSRPGMGTSQQVMKPQRWALSSSVVTAFGDAPGGSRRSPRPRTTT